MIASTGPGQSGLHSAEGVDLRQQMREIVAFKIYAVGHAWTDRQDGIAVNNAVVTVRLTDQYGPDALAGLAAFSHAEIVLLHESVRQDEIETGAMHPGGRANWPLVGIFAQRDARRPNRIGSAITEIVDVAGTIVSLRGLTVVDGTPVIDIKPVFRSLLPERNIKEPRWAAEMTAIEASL